jgi:DNA-binding LacI/PurR family transcriptional regulator
MAIGLLGAARELGVRIPEDLAVVGFDDITTARYLNPPLTTVTVDAYGLGRRAVSMMLAALQADDAPPSKSEMLPARLTVRESCGEGRAAITPSPR